MNSNSCVQIERNTQIDRIRLCHMIAFVKSLVPHDAILSPIGACGDWVFLGNELNTARPFGWRTPLHYRRLTHFRKALSSEVTYIVLLPSFYCLKALSLCKKGIPKTTGAFRSAGNLRARHPYHLVMGTKAPDH
jgi:hypothetical protein